MECGVWPGGGKPRFCSCLSPDRVPERCRFSSASAWLRVGGQGSQGQAEMGLLASRGTQHCFPTALLPWLQGSASEPGHPSPT